MDPQAQTGTAPPPPPGFVPLNADSSRAGNAPPPPPGFQPINGTPAQSDTMAVQNPTGLVESGNLPIWNRPKVKNADGSYSSEYSVSFADDKGREVLVPTVVNGKFQQEKAMFRAAWQNYLKTGQHLGKFDSPEHADAYATALHNRGDRAAGAQATQPFPNTNGEGLYSMTSPDGRAVQIPFSKVKQLASPSHPSGYSFSTPAEAAKFAKDFREAPVTSLQDLLDGIDELPNWTHYVPGMQPAQQAVGGTSEMARTVQGARKIAGAEPQQPDALATLAAHKPTNPQQASGALEEQGGEYVSASELLGLLGGGAKALTEAGKVAQTLQRFPQLARILKVGMNAVQKIPEIEQAVLGAGQTFVKTGGDTKAALAAGAETAAAGGALRAAGAVGAGINAARAGAPVETGPGPAEYAQAAGAAIKPELENVAEAQRKPVMMNQPGGAPAVASGATALPANIREINVGKILAQTGDYSAARSQLQKTLNDATSAAVDETTAGRVRELNEEISAAQDLDTPEGNLKAKQKLDELRTVINDNRSNIDPKLKQAINQGWTKYYALQKVTKGLDKSLMGLPGDTAVSQAQRGINGKQMMSSLQSSILAFGRETVADALGGEENLQSLQRIAEFNQTQAKRTVFNKGFLNVVRNMAHGAMLGGVAGQLGGVYHIGAAAGAGAVGAYEAKNAVMNALRSNPKIAQNFLFALESGATPEKYGPFIAEMIQKANTDASREGEAQQ